MAITLSSLLAYIAVALATWLVGTYFYFAHIFTYWKKRGVYYIRPTWFVGNLGGVAFQREHLGEYLKKVYDDNPDQPVVGLFAAKRPLLMVKDFDVLRRVLVKDAHAFLDRSNDRSNTGDPLFTKTLFSLSGKKWRYMRVKLTPTFTSGKIKNMFHLVNMCGEALLSCLEKEISKGGAIAVKDVVARYSTDVIASCAFGVDANALGDPKSEFRVNTRKLFERSKYRELVKVSTLFVPWLVKLLGLKTRDEGINDYIRKIFWEVADARRRSKVARKDFVDILMQLMDKGEVRAHDEKEVREIKQDSKYMDGDTTTPDNTDIKLDSDDFVAQAFIFIAAGFETASSIVSFTLYELALNDDIQDKLRREMVAVLNKHKSQITYDAITEMAYLEMVVSETTRKYPTLPVLERRCLVDYQIPGTDITVEQGTSVLIPVLGIHMDPDLYPEPHKYDPERFTAENKSRRPNFTHLPFGEGPRICIGMRFGQMQVKTALVQILTSFKVRPCAETPLTLNGMHPTSTVNVPRKQIILAFEKIK